MFDLSSDGHESGMAVPGEWPNNDASYDDLEIQDYQESGATLSQNWLKTEPLE